MSVFKDRTLLITGGTGSFGNAVLRRFLDSDIKEIRIFSRDEKKQDDMRHALQSPKVKFYIGNVRNKQSRWTTCLLVFHDSAYFSHSNDGAHSFWCSLVAGVTFAALAVCFGIRDDMDFGAHIQSGNTDVW